MREVHKPSGVVCSCGRTAVIRWSERQGRFTCRAKGWRYTQTPAPGDDEPRMWNCGRRGHRMQFGWLDPAALRSVGYRTRAAVMWCDEGRIPGIAVAASRQVFRALNELRIELGDRIESGMTSPLLTREHDRLTRFVDAWVEQHIPSPPIPVLPA